MVVEWEEKCWEELGFCNIGICDAGELGSRNFFDRLIGILISCLF